MTSHEIWLKLLGDDEFLKECVLLLYNLQTSVEQVTKSTTHKNRIGFNTADARFLTSFASQILYDKKVAGGYPVDNDDLIIAREKMQKYTRQIANILNISDD